MASSNLSFSFRGNETVRTAIHSVFLYHAINAGMDMGIINPGQITIYNEINPELLTLVENLVLNKDDNATDRFACVRGLGKTDCRKKRRRPRVEKKIS